MDYEKAYKEAIKRAKAMIEVAEKEEEVYKSAITIFPELVESKDERIRKQILNYFVAQKVNEPQPVLDSWITWLEKQGKHKDYYTKQELIDMGFSFMLNGDIVTPNEMMEDMKKYLAWKEKQGEKNPNKVSIWKHWKDGITGGAEGEQIFLIKIGRVYSITSCLGCECDYIELSELDKLMREEKQGWQKWNEEDIKFIDMLIKEKEDALCLSCDVKESISLTYCCNALKLIKQRMKEQL